MLTNMLGRAALSIIGRGRPLQRARLFSGDTSANWPEGMRKFLEREKIDKPALIQDRTLPVVVQNTDSINCNKSQRSLLGNTMCLAHNSMQPSLQYMPVRQFHARGSKVKYMDFRYRLSTCHFRSHLIIIRRQKMKKHKRRKWRKKFKCVLAKQRLMREISKEKAFRVELLTMIKRAEQFDPREYALNKIRELNSKPKELSREERLEELKELIRKHRYQVDYIKPKHKRPETYGLNL